MKYWILDSGTIEQMKNAKPPLPKCACGEPAEARCTWPVEKWTKVVVHDLRHGDVCRNIAASRTGRILSIRAVESLFNPNLLEFTIARLHKGSSTGRVDIYRWDISATVGALRPGLCHQPVCFRHLRDLGDDQKFICSDHWGAQLAAIA